MDWPSASLFRVTPRRAAARGSVDRVLLVCFAVDARVGLLVAHRVVGKGPMGYKEAIEWLSQHE